MKAVASYLMTSSQKREAENDLPRASAAPALRADDVATVRALLWYSGRQQYRVSLLFRRSPSPPNPPSARSQR